MSKRNKRSQNNLFNDFNAESDDFVLVDLQTKPNEPELSPVPLSTFLEEEETINRLLVNPSVEPKNEDIDKYHLSDDALIIDDIDLTDDFLGSNQFIVGPIDPDEDKKFIETPDNLVSKNVTFNFNDLSEDLQSIDDSFFVEEVVPEPTITSDREPVTKVSLDAMSYDRPAVSEPTHETPVSAELDTDIKKPKAFKFKAEKKNNQNNEFSAQKANNTRYFNYVSLGIGSIALLVALVATYKVINLQGRVTKLTDLTSILEEDVSSLSEKSSNIENTHTDLSIEQLKQSDKKRAESENLDIKVKEKKNRQEPVLEKIPNIKKAGSQTSFNENTRFLKVQSKSKVLISANKTPLIKHDRELQKTKKTTLENKKAIKQVVLVLSKHKSKETHKEPNWFVNLVSFKDQGDAKRKAVKLIQQGIPVRVSLVETNKNKWYQLKVGGFKNKTNAASYASKVKKSLNLNRVTVSL